MGDCFAEAGVGGRGVQGTYKTLVKAILIMWLLCIFAFPGSRASSGYLCIHCNSVLQVLSDILILFQMRDQFSERVHGHTSIKVRVRTLAQSSDPSDCPCSSGQSAEHRADTGGLPADVSEMEKTCQHLRTRRACFPAYDVHWLK